MQWNTNGRETCGEKEAIVPRYVRTKGYNKYSLAEPVTIFPTVTYLLWPEEDIIIGMTWYEWNVF